MNPLDRYDKQTRNVRSNRSADAQKAREKLANAPVELQSAFVELLSLAENDSTVHMRFQHSGVSIYTTNSDGGEITCAHMNLLARDNAIRVYLQIDVPDPKQLFSKKQETNKHIRHGVIQGTPQDVEYVQDLWRRAIEKAKRSR